MFSFCNTIFGRSVRASGLVNDSLFNTKLLEGRLDKFWGIVSLNDFWCDKMLGNDFLCKLGNNVKNLYMVFDEIYLADSSIIINKHYIMKISQGRRDLGGAINVSVNQVEGT